MRAYMQPEPLGLHLIRERVSTLFAERGVTTMTADGSFRQSYRDVLTRAAGFAAALDELGIEAAGRVATFAWNSADHLMLYLAIPCSGRVMHTANIRLHPEQVAYTLEHADDRIVVVDGLLWPTFAEIALPACVDHVVVTEPVPAELPRKVGSAQVHRLEDLLAGRAQDYPWVRANEDDAAGVCYTSGTTGNPKCVVYSHRSTYLHALALTTVDGFGIAHRDTTLPVVPMFHANAWGVPYASLLAGADLAMPSRHTDPEGLALLIEEAHATFSAGVPTVWAAVAEALASGSLDRSRLASLQRIVIGGSAVPESLLNTLERFDIPVLHAWGMTESSPVGLVAYPPVGAKSDELRPIQLSQGRPLPGLRVRVVDESGGEAGGGSPGELQISGPWVAAAYHRPEDVVESSDRFVEDVAGTWLRTGDVATIDRLGYVHLVDRTKDLVKSGGEWISSVDLENRLMRHEGIREAAVIAVPHPKWDERPLACVVRTDPALRREDVLAFLAAQLPKWQVPDDVVFLDEVPKTSVGKLDKKRLRSMHAVGELGREDDGA